MGFCVWIGSRCSPQSPPPSEHVLPGTGFEDLQRAESCTVDLFKSGWDWMRLCLLDSAFGAVEEWIQWILVSFVHLCPKVLGPTSSWEAKHNLSSWSKPMESRTLHSYRLLWTSRLLLSSSSFESTLSLDSSFLHSLDEQNVEDFSRRSTLLQHLALGTTFESCLNKDA